MRLLILFAIIYLLIRSVKSWWPKRTPSQQSVSNRTAGEIDDVMIKDPFCDAYFPKRTGVLLKMRGKELFFCSTTCRDEYIKGDIDANNK
jgi:YHS domain-containing protein